MPEPTAEWTACNHQPCAFCTPTVDAVAVTAVERFADDLFRWNTPRTPYFVINGRHGEHPTNQDPYVPIVRAVVGSVVAELDRLDAIGNTRRDLINDDDWAWFTSHPVVRDLAGHTLLSTALPAVRAWLHTISDKDTP